MLDKNFNLFLNALKINKLLKTIRLSQNVYIILDDFKVINEDYCIKPFISIIKTLNNKNKFKLLNIDYMYDINTLHHILQNNFNYNIKLTLKCCNMKNLISLPKYLENHKNKIQLEINVFENNYYEEIIENNEIFKKYKYYHNNIHNIEFLKCGYNPFEYFQEDLDNIYENKPKI